MHDFIFVGVWFLLVAWVWVQFIEPNWFRLTHKTLQMDKPLAKPLTILHVSDPHFAKERPWLNRFFDRLSRHEVDFVFATGDLIDDSRGIASCITNLKKLKARHGVFIVLGNHDYRTYPPFENIIHMVTGLNLTQPRKDIEEFKESLREAGFHLLLNKNISIVLEGHSVSIIGVDDPVTGRANLEEAFAGCSNGTLRLALTHSPLTFPALKQYRVDIAFAGHTHGGQIRFPLIGPIPLAYRISPIIDSTDRYGFVGLVSRGLGAQPVGRQRLFCRPEAMLVRLEGKDS